MIFRTSTCLTMLLAAGAGLYLYQTKHRSQLLDREIVRTIKQTEQVRERSSALQGEWAVLNEIDRLSELAKLHSSALRNPAATQFVALADLPARLPAPLPPGSTPALPEEDAGPALSPAQLALARSGLPQAAAKVVDAPAPAAVPAAEPKSVAAQAPPKPIVTAARPVPPVPRAAHVADAASRPADPAPAARISAPVVNVTAATIPSGNTIGESVARVARGLPPLQAPAAYAAPAYVQAAVTPVASMLGSGTHPSLPPPTPYAGH